MDEDYAETLDDVLKVGLVFWLLGSLIVLFFGSATLYHSKYAPWFVVK